MSMKRRQETKTRGKNKQPGSRRSPKASKAGAMHGASNVSSGSKIGLVVALLRRSGGASIADLSKATGWQAHSVRGAISATVKKKLCLKLASERVDGVRVYRVVG